LNWKELSSHQQRLITGISLAVPLFALIGMGPPWSWALLVSAVSVLALWEFEGLVCPAGSPAWERWLYYALGWGMPWLTWWAAVAGLHGGLVLGLFLVLTGVLLSAPNDPAGLNRLAHRALAWLYIPYMLSFILLIGRAEEARAWIFFLLLVTMAGDAGAYYCGKAFGSRKLYQRVSPNKTVEGSMGGFLCSLAVGGALGAVLFQSTPLTKIAGLTAVLSIVGQLGDLFESMIKRMSGKKDSSQILPGHGGILDRLDSLLFVFPVVWFFIS
jgi:phosphatidate cytidylyltransferase